MKARDHEKSFRHHRMVSTNMTRIKRKPLPQGGLLEPLLKEDNQSITYIEGEVDTEISPAKKS